MDTGSGDPRDDLRQAIDDEINSLEQSIRVLKSRRNTLAPISCLPPETLATIFSFLSPDEGDFHLDWICFSRVCRHWRETALNYPRLWSHINFRVLYDSYKNTEGAPAIIAEILARAKTVPLHLDFNLHLVEPGNDAFLQQIDAHISQTRHLRVTGPLISVKPLVSSAPILESLSLLRTDSYTIPIPSDLFNCTTPSLRILELENFDISWKAPLLKGLQSLELRYLSVEAPPELEDWLDALNEMPQLKTLSLHSATPVAPPAPLISEPSRTITLPSLTKFHISSSAKNCTLALAHLVMPALAWLHVDANSDEVEGEDVRPLIPYVARNACRLQDTEPLRSILISDNESSCVNVFAGIPDTDLEYHPIDPDRYNTTIPAVPARLRFTATNTDWHRGVGVGIYDTLLAVLPLDSVSTFMAHSCTEFSKEFWLSQAPRWSSLEQAHLAPAAVKVFSDMLAENAPPDGPRLPTLTKLVLLRVELTAPRMLSLRDMLIERVERGVPLDVLDLCTCFAFAPEHIIQLLGEVVVDVKEPLMEVVHQTCDVDVNKRARW